MTGLVEGLILLGATGAFGSVAYSAKRIMGKLDGIDKVLRGDGNGNPGLGEKVRNVHEAVDRVQAGMDAHLVESARNVAQLQDQGKRLVRVETRCALIDCDGEES